MLIATVGRPTLPDLSDQRSGFGANNKERQMLGRAYSHE